MFCPSSWEIYRGANVVTLEELQLPTKSTGLKRKGSLYTFEGVQPSIPTSEHLTRCGSATSSTPLEWDHGRQKHQAAPYRNHGNTDRSSSQNCHSQSRKLDASLQLSMGPSLEVQLADWMRPDQTFRPIRAYAVCDTSKRGECSAKSKRALVRTPPHQFNAQHPIETLFATDKPVDPFPTGLHPAP